ncbi:Peptide methionine sulfoxide reductase MsrA [archaeon GW2011_AR15]|nr:Peptide methionine sulfoxide reductase MsrA [archaeon GW2011_AR15]
MAETATFGAGCFWGVEHEFSKVKGVLSTEVGFMGGDAENPSYQLVCTNTTGHAEVVHVKYDPKKVPYEKLLEVFWRVHDPTQLNRQGPDVGTQYRSVIFYYNEEQKKKAEKSLKEEQKKHSKKIATAIVEAEEFYRAEEYHQKYYEKKGCIENLFK